MTGIKFDEGKPRPELLHPDFILAVSRVLAYGSEKYDDDNWQYVENLDKRYTGAAMRHLMAYMAGEPSDEETGESHLAHCACCLMFLFWEEQNRLFEEVDITMHELIKRIKGGEL